MIVFTLHGDTPENLTERGAGVSMAYGIDAILDAASDISLDGTYLGAIVVGTVNLILPSSTGNSVRYVIVILALVLGF